MVRVAKGIIVRNPLTVIGGVVTLIALLIVAVVAFELSPAERNFALITIMGLVANSIPSLLALLKSEATQHDIRNGVVKNKVKEAIVEVAEDTDSEGVYIQTKREGDNGNGRQGS